MVNKVLTAISLGLTLLAVGMTIGAIYAPHWVSFHDDDDVYKEYSLFIMTDDDFDSGHTDNTGESWSCIQWQYCEFSDEYDNDVYDGLCDWGTDMAKAGLAYYVCHILALCFMVLYIIGQVAVLIDRDGGHKIEKAVRCIWFALLSLIGFACWWGLTGASYDADCQYEDWRDDLLDGDKP